MMLLLLSELRCFDLRQHLSPSKKVQILKDRVGCSFHLIWQECWKIAVHLHIKQKWSIRLESGFMFT